MSSTTLISLFALGLAFLAITIGLSERWRHLEQTPKLGARYDRAFGLLLLCISISWGLIILELIVRVYLLLQAYLVLA